MTDILDTDWEQEGATVRASYSSLNLHRRCAQAWTYRYFYGLKRPQDGPTPELDFGSWWGALVGVDALTRGRALDSLIVPPRTWQPVDSGPEFDQATVTRNDIIGAAKEWWRNQSLDVKAAWDEKLGITDLPKRLHGAFIRWKDEWAAEQKHERPLAVELEVERELPATYAPFLGDGPAVVLFGYIDEVYEDEQRHMVVVRDYKTGKNITQNSAVDDLMDSQLMVYEWMAEPILAQYGVGAPKAIAYDRTRSSQPATPQLTLAGALSKAVTAFDLRTYREWAAKDTRPLELASAAPVDGESDEEAAERAALSQSILSLPAGQFYGKPGEYVQSGKNKGNPKFGVYELDPQVEEKLATPAHRAQFYTRTRRPVSRNVIAAHLQAAADTSEAIWRTEARAMETGAAPRSMTRMTCGFCDYLSLCQAQMIGGTDGEFDLAEYNLVRRGGRRLLTITNGKIETEETE